MFLALRVVAKIVLLGVTPRSFRPTTFVPRALIDTILVTTVTVK